MPTAWVCPDHGAFLQSGLIELQSQHAWARAPGERLACPRCRARGDYGFLKPASEFETQELLQNAA